MVWSVKFINLFITVYNCIITDYYDSLMNSI